MCQKCKRTSAGHGCGGELYCGGSTVQQWGSVLDPGHPSCLWKGTGSLPASRWPWLYLRHHIQRPFWQGEPPPLHLPPPLNPLKPPSSHYVESTDSPVVPLVPALCKGVHVSDSGVEQSCTWVQILVSSLWCLCMALLVLLCSIAVDYCITCLFIEQILDAYTQQSLHTTALMLAHTGASALSSGWL